MIMDSSLQFCAAQAVTASADATDSIDLGIARDLGAGEDIFLMVTVDEAATAAGAATVSFQFKTSATSNLAGPTINADSGPIPKFSLTLGSMFAIKLPPSNYLRYGGAGFVVATGPLTAGKFTACLVKDVQNADIYPSGFSVK